MKLSEWHELNNSSDWQKVSSENGLDVYSKASERGLNIFRASKILPYKAEEVFKTMMTKKNKPMFDENYGEYVYLSKICANTYTTY